MTHKNYIWAIVGILLIAAIMIFSSPQKEMGPVEEEDTIFCPADVRQCSDGSFVAREAPSCAFAPCPPGTTLLEEDASVIPE